MGLRNRETRRALEKVDEEEFAAFLDDVSDVGLTAACADRVWTVGATLNWIRDDEGRLAWYEGALKVKSEVLAHETLEIADVSGEPKLRIDTRFKVAAKWYRDRYGEMVQVKHAGTVAVDAGLLIGMGEILARLSRPAERVLEHMEADAVEMVPEVVPATGDLREQHGDSPPQGISPAEAAALVPCYEAI